MIRINLLPVRAAQKKEQLQGQLAILAVAVVLTLVACSGIYASLSASISAEEDQIRVVETEISSLRKVIGEVAHFKKLQDELRGKLEVLDQLKAGKTGPVLLLDEISQIMPARLWLNKFTESNGAVSITGVGYDEETVAQFLKALQDSPFYDGVELRVTQQTSQGNMKLQSFDISARSVRPAVATPER